MPLILPYSDTVIQPYLLAALLCLSADAVDKHHTSHLVTTRVMPLPNHFRHYLSTMYSFVVVCNTDPLPHHNYRNRLPAGCSGMSPR